MLDNDLLQKAIKILDDGGLVGIPTETVYGLAADAENQEAVQSIYKAKKSAVQSSFDCSFSQRQGDSSLGQRL